MIAVVLDRVVLIRCVFLAHSRDQNVVDLESCQLANRLILRRFVVVAVLDSYLKLEGKMLILFGDVQIDAGLSRHRASTVREFVFSNLDGRMVHSEA